jgi:type VI secretion system protein ImpK
MPSRFFGERIGGVRFFDELTRLQADPLVNYELELHIPVLTRLERV